MWYTHRLADAGIAPSVWGAKGTRLTIALRRVGDRALQDGDHSPTRACGAALEAVEFATLEWVDWFSMRRLLGPIGDVPPAEFEAQYYEQAKVA